MLYFIVLVESEQIVHKYKSEIRAQTQNKYVRDVVRLRIDILSDVAWKIRLALAHIMDRICHHKPIP
jgi:hypothetical protein